MKLEVGDQVWYGNNQFGFYVGMKKVYKTVPVEKGWDIVPFGSVEGQTMVALWNPNVYNWNAMPKPVEFNVYIPKDKIIRIVKKEDIGKVI